MEPTRQARRCLAGRSFRKLHHVSSGRAGSLLCRAPRLWHAAYQRRAWSERRGAGTGLEQRLHCGTLRSGQPHHGSPRPCPPGQQKNIAPAITFGYLAGKHASHEAVTQPDNMSNQNNNKKENKIVEKPTIAGREPIAVNVKEGRTYYWCSCGKTGTEPFCDGAHEGTSFLPLEFTAETTDKVSLCTCKQTKNPPYCDGSHCNLDKPENEEVQK